MENNDFIPPLPNNHLAWAILVTIFCCLPFGIVAITKANKVNTLYAARQFDMAQMASEDAKKWCIITLVTGIVLNGIILAIYCASIFALSSM